MGLNPNTLFSERKPEVTNERNKSKGAEKDTIGEDAKGIMENLEPK